MDNYATRVAYTGSPLQTTWQDFMSHDPVAGHDRWYKDQWSPYDYGQMQSSIGISEYGGTAYRGHQGYDPVSGFTSRIITQDLQNWLREEYPEMFTFDSGTVNAGGGISAGDVSRGTSFGEFHTTPEVYDYIQQAANKYGIPANFLKVMIHHESSGNWARDGNRTPFVPSHNGRILPYVGIFDFALESRLGLSIDSLVGDMPGQIDAAAAIMRQIYDEIRAENPEYGWLNVDAMYYSGDPSGNTNPAGWEQHGTTQARMAKTQALWNQEDQWVVDNGGTLWSQNGSISTPDTAYWQKVNQWDQYVLAAADRYGVPANLIKAVIRMESGGDPNARNEYSGATGLMQIMPGIHNGGNWQQLQDPAYNIDMGARILKSNFDQWGSWENAVKAYLAGTPHSTAYDAMGSNVNTYWSAISGYWDELDANASGRFGAEGQPTEAVSNINMIWGGGDFGITQEHGPSDWANKNAWMYEYSYGVLGHLGHPGIDVGMPVGTRLFSPASGTVIIAGGSGSYENVIGVSAPQTGELRIRLDNGHEVILGHMAGIHVTVGDRVTAGQYVGLSGYTAAPHLHLEYRIPNPNMSSGWEAVDPREALRGVYGGSFTTAGSVTSGPGIDRPYTYQDILRTGATGGTFYGGMTYSSGNSWNEWLQAFQRGENPNWGTGQGKKNLPLSDVVSDAYSTLR